MCQHPVSSLRDFTAEVTDQTITIKCSCGECAAPITKQALQRTPQPEPHPRMNSPYSRPGARFD